MFDQLPRERGGRVVEVGAGIGTFSARLLAAGADRAAPDRARGRVRGRARAALRGRPARRDPRGAPARRARARERPGSFDFVLSQNVLEHIPDDAARCAAMARALRPGGRLMALVPAHPRLYGSLDRAYGHERRYTPSACARSRRAPASRSSACSLQRPRHPRLVGAEPHRRPRHRHVAAARLRGPSRRVAPDRAARRPAVRPEPDRPRAPAGVSRAGAVRPLPRRAPTRACAPCPRRGRPAR